MRGKEYSIKIAKQNCLRKLLTAGGDNFRWVGFGRVYFPFRGRSTPSQKVSK